MNILTEQYIQALPAAPKENYQKVDSLVVAGSRYSLTLEVNVAGTRRWWARMIANGVDTNVSIGAYLQPGGHNHMSLEDARQAAYDAWCAARRSKNVERRVVSDVSLGALMQELAKQPRITPAIAAIELFVRLGGQRLNPLLRLKRRDVSPDFSIVTFPENGWPEPLPTLPRSAELLSHQFEIGRALEFEFLFTENGRTALRGQTVFACFADLVENIAEQDMPGFSLYDIRRTVEIWLSARGVTRQALDRILGHGYSGFIIDAISRPISQMRCAMRR